MAMAMAMTIVKPRGLDLVGGEEEALESIVKHRGFDLVGGEEEALESIVKSRGLDLVGGEEEALESKETRTGINPNPYPNKRAKEEEETQTVRSENKKLKEEKASFPSADDTQAPNPDHYFDGEKKKSNQTPNFHDPKYFEHPDRDPNDTRPILKKYQNLNMELENLHMDVEGYDSSSDEDEIMFKRVPVNRSVVCDICKATDHEAPACYCWWRIPPGVKVDEEKYDIICHCGMGMEDGKCSRGKACLRPLASHIMSKAYRLAVMKNFNVEDYKKKKPYKMK